LAAALIAGGCGSDSPSAQSPPGTHSARRAFAGYKVLADSTAADFVLRDQHGALVRLSAQRGRFVLLTFLYTHCRDVCPVIAEHLQAALGMLGADRNRVRILAVSVDPVGDTPAAVRDFVRLHRLGSQFSYLTGTRKQLAPVWQAYNILATQRNEQVVDHSAPTLLIDPNGRPRLYYDSNVTTAGLVHDLRRLMRP